MRKIQITALVLLMALLFAGCCLQHNYLPATCTEPATCSKCGKTTGSALGHTEAVDPAVAPSWQESGLTEGRHCSVCGEVLAVQETLLSLDAASAALISEGRYDEVPALLSGHAGTEIAERVFSALQAAAERKPEAEAAELAGRYGAFLTDPDTQLRYCALLREAGYELSLVYPEGVAVEMNLAPYQALLLEQTGTPDFSRALVFSREEDAPETEVVSHLLNSGLEESWDTLSSARFEADYPYRVRFRPEMMNMLYERDMAAESMEDCTALVLLESGYLPDSMITIRTSSSGTMVSYRGMPYYAAYGMIAIYDPADPTVHEVYNSYVNFALMRDSVVGNAYDDANIDLDSLALQEIQAALQDPESEESQEILSRYDESVIEFVKQEGWGDYLLVPDYDANGQASNFKATSNNLHSWNTPKYMLGTPDETWIQAELDDGAIENILLYYLLQF